MTPLALGSRYRIITASTTPSILSTTVIIIIISFIVVFAIVTFSLHAFTKINFGAVEFYLVIKIDHDDDC